LSVVISFTHMNLNVNECTYKALLMIGVLCWFVFILRARKPLDELLVDVPPDASDLLHALLQFNPDKRLTAEQALKHSYVKRYVLSILHWLNTTSENPGNLLEFKNLCGNPGNFLEFNGPPGNFWVRWSTALVSDHKTGYQIAYLRNWSPYFIFATAPCCIKCILCFCSIFRQTTCTG